MQKIFLKKTVDLNHQLKELVSISVDESVTYKVEKQGMRAVGSIIINGEYKDIHSKLDFHDSVDLDILATFDKIIDKKDFHIKVEDFDYSISDGNLELTIQACVYGVKDDDDRVIETEQLLKDNEDSQEMVEEIEELLRQDCSSNCDTTNEKNKQINIDENTENKVIEEDTNVADDDLGTYYLYVVDDGDTYHSISQHYKVDEFQLKQYNHERSLHKNDIVIIPYFYE